MGSDYGGFSYVQSIISIHATRVGSDFLPAGHAATACIFLFTPPVWAATHNGGAYNMRNVFLFTPPVQVATSKPLSVSHDSNISIHATRVGSDLDVCEFLAGELISIHATRVGSDHVRASLRRCNAHFYSRHPCGQRQQYCTILFHYFVIMLCNQPDL